MFVLKRLFYKVINPFRKIYWYLLRPQTLGVKCLIEHEGKFLCILNSYYPKWTFPGGGVSKYESPLEAARREALEEIGLDIQDWRLLGEYRSEREHKKDIVYCFHVKVSASDFCIDNCEVIQADWFSREDIPEPRSFAIKEVLTLY